MNYINWNTEKNNDYKYYLLKFTVEFMIIYAISLR